MNFYQGIIVDRDDPYRMGRVKVRVIGVHPVCEEQIPNSALPWAKVLFPVTNANNEGVQSFGSGLMIGSAVMVCFLDEYTEEYQNPLVLGSLSQIHFKKSEDDNCTNGFVPQPEKTEQTPVEIAYTTNIYGNDQNECIIINKTERDEKVNQTSSSEVSYNPQSDEDKIYGENTIYPFNKVYQSESGHVLEIDDTKGSERISINHRTGTFIEFDPNGDLKDTVLCSRYSSINGDNYSHIKGFSSITVDKNLKLLLNTAKNQTTKEKSYDLDIEVEDGANVNITIKKGNCNLVIEKGDVNFKLNEGDMTIRQEKGDYKHYVNGNYYLHVTGQMDTIIGKNHISNIQGSRYTQVDGELDYLNMTNSNAHLETWGYKECKRMTSDIYINSLNYVLRSDEQIIIETGKGSIGELILSSAGNISLASGWDSTTQQPSSHPNPNINILSGNNTIIWSGNDIKLKPDSQYLHIDSSYIRFNGTTISNPNTSDLLGFSTIYINNYNKIDYNDILNEGFSQIVIPKIIK